MWEMEKMRDEASAITLVNTDKTKDGDCEHSFAVLISSVTSE